MEVRFLVHRGNVVYIVNNILTLQRFEGEKGKKETKKLLRGRARANFVKCRQLTSR